MIERSIIILYVTIFSVLCGIVTCVILKSKGKLRSLPFDLYSLCLNKVIYST